MVRNTASYYRAGGDGSFADYFDVMHATAAIDPALRRNIVFAAHNLVTDAAFNQFQLIVCRNVLIYFDDELIERVLDLFARSLLDRGFLCIGSKESLRFHEAGQKFERVDTDTRVYRKRASVARSTL